MSLCFVDDGIRICLANIVTAFDAKTIGSKVLVAMPFAEALIEAIKAFDFEAQRVPGQGFLPLQSAVSLVSAGVGKRSPNPEDYVVREHRGQVAAYLKRDLASPCETLAVIVYTKLAYLTDPDITDDEATRVNEVNPTHLIVAVLATAGPRPPYPPRTLVRNLAGANHEAATWTPEEIRSIAKASIEYDEQWATVAD